VNIRECKEWNNKEPMLSTNTRLLVAIAGAVSLNCKPCLETLVPAALRYGIVPEEIAEVVSIVTEVRENVSTFTRDLITKLLGWETMEEPKQACCGLNDECLTEPVGSADME
jgi:hypothetical protein